MSLLSIFHFGHTILNPMQLVGSSICQKYKSTFSLPDQKKSINMWIASVSQIDLSSV